MRQSRLACDAQHGGRSHHQRQLRRRYLPRSPTNGVYTASKAGLNHLTKTLALEMAPFNIRVNAILPGSVRTEDYEDASGGDDEYFAKMAENEPLKRLGKEEDFGAAAVYLASDASSWVTGTLLMVAGHP